MVKHTGPEDPNVRVLIEELRRAANQQEAPIWKRVADELAKPRRQRAAVNLDIIEKSHSPQGIVLIPGKVLGNGILTKKGVSVVALQFSETAKTKIANAGGKALSITEAIKKWPTGKDVTLLI